MSGIQLIPLPRGATGRRGRRTIRYAFACATAFAVPVHAQWTVTNLEPDAGPQLESQALGIFGTQQVGVAGNFAAIWNGTAASWESINPASAGFSQLNGVSGGPGGPQQVGWAHIISENSVHAGVWSGSAASFVDLNPPGAFNSEAFATNGTQQVGRAFIFNPPNSHDHAILWNGSAASWIDLDPPSSNHSEAFGISATQQVGYIINNTVGSPIAALWSGSAASYVNLNPSGSNNSMAYGISGTQQVGFASTFDYGHSACVWSGSAASWVDLGHLAAGTDYSEARATNGSLQVGHARIAFGDTHAWLWNYPTQTSVDLHAFLPAAFSESFATGVWSDATHDYVSGFGYNSETERYEALLWTRAGGLCTSPQVTSQPQPVNTCPAYGAQFLVGASGSAPLSYQWQWQPAGEQFWVVLVNGPNINPATSLPVFHGLDAGTAHIFALPPYGAGVNGIHLRCVVSNACGNSTSNPVVLTVCVADIDDGTGTGACDLGVTIDDLIYYLGVFELGDVGADVDDGSGTGMPDGGVTIDDLIYYLTRFEAGC